jgi:hypothetical protein
MTAWKKIQEKKNTTDDKKLVTTRTTSIQKVHVKEEPVSKANVKPVSMTAKKIFIGVCILGAVIYLMSVFL